MSPVLLEWLIWLLSMKCDPSLRNVQWPGSTLRKAKKKNSVSQSCRLHLFFCAHLILQNSYFHFFFLKLFFWHLTTKNEESLLFWKNLSTWELKKRVKSHLISENTEVETFQSFLVSDVHGGKGELNLKKNRIKDKKTHAASVWKILASFETKYFFFSPTLCYQIAWTI